MREGAKHRSYSEQNENDNGDEIREDDDRPATTSQWSIGDPDSHKRVRTCKGVADGWVLVL